MKKQFNQQNLTIIILIAVLSFSIGVFIFPGNALQNNNHMINIDSVTIDSMGEHRINFLSFRDSMRGEMMNNSMYRCCLENPCTYCIEKTPGHGEDATCNCLEDVVEGRHPCGECIGEILEGHGNPYLAEYFALAISEEVGMQHIGTLREIIAEKYGLAVEKQL